VPISIGKAREAVGAWHRHLPPPPGGLFALAVAHEGEVVGVAIVGRPVARMRDNGWTAEVTRVATNGHPNACSKLLGAAWRTARALGYRRLYTYTLAREDGASLRGAGWSQVGSSAGGSWARASRPRSQGNEEGPKKVWCVSSGEVPEWRPTFPRSPSLQLTLLRL
jgi:hypothetical protein